MQCSGHGRKAQASLLLVSTVAIAVFLGWVYMKYLGVETFYRSVANTYDIENALYTERLVEGYVDTAARLSYQMALSEVSRDEDFSYVPFLINNRLSIPPEEYFEGRLGELTLEYANSFLGSISDELGVEIEGFRCFDIRRSGDGMEVRLSGGMLRINGTARIERPLEVSFTTRSSVFELYRTNREIVEAFFDSNGKVKTACEFSVDSCNLLGSYMKVYEIAGELERVAAEKSGGDVVCRIGIEKAFMEPYVADTQCKISGTCRLLPRQKAFIGTGSSCSPYGIPQPERREKDYFKYKGRDFQNCYEYRRMLIEYEISVICRKRGEFVFDEKEKRYRELEFGSVIWSKADSDYGCVSVGKVEGTNRFVGKAGDGTCLCTNICTICGNSQEFASPCDCSQPVVDENGIIVAGPGFYSEENLARFLLEYGIGDHPECSGLDPSDVDDWPRECKEALGDLRPVCRASTCAPPSPSPPPAG